MKTKGARSTGRGEPAVSREPLRSWSVGDRVVIAWHRREYAATVVKTGKRFYIVETDEPYGVAGDRRMPRTWFEMHDIFSDGRTPDA